MVKKKTNIEKNRDPIFSCGLFFENTIHQKIRIDLEIKMKGELWKIDHEKSGELICLCSCQGKKIQLER